MEDICRSVCFTGHRELPKEKRALLEERLYVLLRLFAEEGAERFLAGGARGFDTLAARTVLKVRRDFPDVRLILVLPCLDQTRGWSAEDIAAYEAIRAQADEVIYTSEQYFNGCMHKRNRRLVDESDVCIAFLQSPVGGTAYTVRYAESQGKEVINMARLLENG